MRNAATLRAQIEEMLDARIPSALTPKTRSIQEVISCGINEIDRMDAFCRGALSEICGLPSTGKTTLLHGLLATCTAAGEAAAVIDVSDAFDPVTASQAGVVLSELLWVRCGLHSYSHGKPLSALEQALGATEYLLQSGGFGLLALDLGDLKEREVMRVPLSSWFRFRRAVEDTRSLFLVIGRQPSAGTSSATVLDLSQTGIDIEENSTASKSRHIGGDCLIQTLRTRGELHRCQMRKPVRSVRSTGEFATRLQSYR